MFDGGAVVCRVGVVEQDWQILHQRLRGIAMQRSQLEAKEIGCLVEAEEARLHLRLGHATFRQYMEVELGWGPHAANERLRVAHELLDLPLLHDEFAAGRVPFSVVRELTRIATADSEEAWLAKAKGKTVRQVEHLVRGRRKGDRPEDPTDPSIIKERIVFEVSGTTFAMIRRARAQMERECGQSLTDDEFVHAFMRGGEREPEGISPPGLHPSCRRLATPLRGAVRNLRNHGELARCIESLWVGVRREHSTRKHGLRLGGGCGRASVTTPATGTAWVHRGFARAGLLRSPVGYRAPGSAKWGVVRWDLCRFPEDP